ncbi:MAG: hypothetical protein M0Z67_08935 [Nitrospiraceae bacterium]|nr:hypothetical protein [Nitrospiraceae bacterium]
MKREIIIFSLIFIAIVVTHGELHAYSSNVHQRLTSETVDQNASTIKTYLNSLFLSAGANEVQNSKTVKDWLIEGSWMEDVSPDIPTSHFYDPLTNKGYSVLGVEIGQSAYDRANDLPNYGPWVWARKRMYDGLIQTDKTLREQYLGIAFQALGRAMHLVQDMAVPAHTRNDFHTADPYEAYTNRNFRSLNYSSISFPDGYVSTSSAAPRFFWDTDTYDGSSVPLTDTIGLAEYSNANFFSADTIFKDYPHPSYADTTYASIDWQHPEVADAEDGKSDNKIYIRKTAGQADARMAAVSYISYDCIRRGYVQYSPWVLDDAVHNDYAAMLIPRAVGYLAGLLNYFFRGTISISVPTNGLYSMIDATQEGFTPAFTAIKLKATNTTTTGENMTNGTIQLVVKYKVAHADPFQPGPIEKDADFSYIVVPEKNDVSALFSASPTELNFDLSQNPIPLWATDVYLQVVFKGTLGNEENAVAIGFKDISEPTPMDLFSNTDQICISGSWYVAGSQQAIEQVDANHNGVADYPSEADVYGHDPQDIYILFSPYSETTYRIASPTFYDIKVSNLAPANHKRVMYLLSDYQFDDTSHVHWMKRDAPDNWPISDVKYLHINYAIERQVDYSEDSGLCGGNPPCYLDYYPGESTSFPAWQTTNFFTFRGARMWWGSPQIYTNLPPTGSQCSFDAL